MSLGSKLHRFTPDLKGFQGVTSCSVGSGRAGERLGTKNASGGFTYNFKTFD